MKNEALRLADLLHNDPRSKAHHDEAAVELRRLVAQRDALLAALHAMLSHTAMLDPLQGFDGFDHSAVNQARAAIKAVEEGK